eukprot:2588152-Pyramimonas_sp.AAC.1
MFCLLVRTVPATILLLRLALVLIYCLVLLPIGATHKETNRSHTLGVRIQALQKLDLCSYVPHYTSEGCTNFVLI